MRQQPLELALHGIALDQPQVERGARTQTPVGGDRPGVIAFDDFGRDIEPTATA